VTTSSYCNLIKITRTDSIEIGLTDLDKDVIYSGLTYQSAAGYTPTNYANDDKLSVNNADVEGILSAAGVDRDDITAGLYDGARIEWFVYDYLAETLLKQLAAGFWGECTQYHGSGRYVAEFRGLTQRLQQTTGEVISPSCLAELGDARCKVVLGPLTVAGSVDSSPDRRHFIDADLIQSAGHWDGGKVVFTSGANDTYEMEVKAHTAGGNIELFLAMAADIAATDTFNIQPGCNKTLAVCRDTFNNVVNRRAFDFLPGNRETSRHIGTL